MTRLTSPTVFRARVFSTLSHSRIRIYDHFSLDIAGPQLYTEAQSIEGVAPAMRYIEDPRQERLFDRYHGLFPPLAARNARWCLRRMSVPETMPDRQHRRGTPHPGVHRQAAPSGRATSGTRNRCLQGTVRDAVGARVDQQRFEVPPGSGATASAWSGKRVSCDLAQTGWLERAASRSLKEAARVGSRADGKTAEKGGVCALWDVFWCSFAAG